MIRILFYVVVLVLLAYGAGGKFAAPFTGGPQGPAASVALADLLADPARFEGHRVTVTGKVADRASVLGYGGLRLIDGQGHEILILGSTTSPAPGEPFSVTGQFITAFTLGSLTLPVIATTGG